MKLRTFKNLKVGDKVTVKSWTELVNTKGAGFDINNELFIPDNKGASGNTFVEEMQEYCGETLEVAYILPIVDMVVLDTQDDTKQWRFTRKMLREPRRKSINDVRAEHGFPRVDTKNMSVVGVLGGPKETDELNELLKAKTGKTFDELFRDGTSLSEFLALIDEL